MAHKLVNRAMALAVACLVAISSVLPTQALATTAAGAPGAMVSTESVVDQEQAAEQRAQVEAFLQRDEVRQQLEALGVDPAEAENRIDGLSDQEIAQIADKIAEDPAGQGIGWVIGAAIVIAAVLFITDVIGVTNIYPFVNP